MTLLGATRDAKVAPHLCGIVVGIRRCPTLPKSEDMAFNPPISWKPPAKPVAMQN